tara:strand:+ start:314 stop:493 length:180 start_codon:yes stop_codon:yes gene_type:complete
MDHFQFTEDQLIEVREIWRDINSQCKILQDQTGCPTSEIVKMIDSAKSYWEVQEKKRYK